MANNSYNISKEEPISAQVTSAVFNCSKSQKKDIKDYSVSDRPYYQLTRPQKKPLVGDSYRRSIKKTDISNIPIY